MINKEICKKCPRYDKIGKDSEKTFWCSKIINRKLLVSLLSISEMPPDDCIRKLEQIVLKNQIIKGE